MDNIQGKIYDKIKDIRQESQTLLRKRIARGNDVDRDLLPLYFDSFGLVRGATGLKRIKDEIGNCVCEFIMEDLGIADYMKELMKAKGR